MRKFAFPAILTIVLAFASVLVAQKMSEPAIGGYCPVAYKAANKPIKGDAKYSSMHNGDTFWFVNADAKAMYDKDPAGYTPEYHNYCATGVAKGMKLESDPTAFTVYEGKTYLFSNKEAKAMFDKEKAKMVADADKNWPSVMGKAVMKMK
ncbi:MAG: YHS domain-containing (seleno)protein [Acidobacteria bacterium]|nr:YHS domain-containing (seleno)protein [Acidobacteriota bacterium]MDA1234596.1 YHS domain-containing (seleno)protein [Acidobacteriota bacterium]